MKSNEQKNLTYQCFIINEMERKATENHTIQRPLYVPEMQKDGGGVGV